MITNNNTTGLTTGSYTWLICGHFSAHPGFPQSTKSAAPANVFGITACVLAEFTGSLGDPIEAHDGIKQHRNVTVCKVTRGGIISKVFTWPLSPRKPISNAAPLFRSVMNKNKK